MGGGIVGSGVKLALTWGMKRGVFSNEAGLGSSVMVHSSSNVKEPVRQGMWGIFEVFADTMVVCTLTAFAVLSSGLIDLDTGAVLVDVSGSALVGQAFATVFGSFGPAFIAIAILLFAFSTVLGWSHYGSKACEYLFGTKSTIVYKVVFVLMLFIGCTMNLGLAWDLSDTFNGLMAIPNLIALLTAVYMLRASGAMDALAAVLSPVLGALGIPPETAALLLVRPVSGSGALAVGSQLMEQYGPDSAVGRTAAVMLGCSETTFYTVAVYFGAAGIRRTRYTIPAALTADLAAFIAAAWAVRLCFGGE